MKIYNDSQLLDKCKDKWLFVDTNTIVLMFTAVDFLEKVIYPLIKCNCVLMTIPSVYFEFTRGADTLDKFNSRKKFLSSLLGVYPIERHLDKFEGFMPVMQKLSPRASYTDFLLSACLFKFNDTYLLSENFKDYPLSVFNREHVVTVDTGDAVRHQAIYSLNLDKLAKATQSVLSTAKTSG